MPEKAILEQALKIAVEALAFYANPENYHAILIVPDRPCGEFAEDMSRTDHPYYSRPMPGKTAREAIAQMQALLPLQEPPTTPSTSSQDPTKP